MKNEKLIMAAEEYHKHFAVGSTSLRTLINRSPAHFLWERENPSEPTPAKRLGTIIHTAILEPKRFQAEAAVEPEFSGKGSVAAREQWHREHHSKLIMKRDHFEMVQGILNSISKHPEASKLLTTGQAEESYFWSDPETGRRCKCRPDRLRDGHILVDVKSTDDASERSFQRTIANFGYHVQAAFYLDGVSEVLGHKFDEFVIVAVEKDPPYAVNTFLIDMPSISEGRALYWDGLKILKRCQDSGIWPAYSEGIKTIGIPTYAYRAGVL